MFRWGGFFRIASSATISTGQSASVHCGPLKENHIMKKKISVYWPLAIVVPLAAVAYLHLYNGAAAQSPLAAERVSAELARTVSYGFVGGEAAMPATARMSAQPM